MKNFKISLLTAIISLPIFAVSKKILEAGCVKLKENVAIEGSKMEFNKFECGYPNVQAINFFLIGDIGGYEVVKNEVKKDGKIVEKKKVLGHLPTPGQWVTAMAMRKYVDEHKHINQHEHVDEHKQKAEHQNVHFDPHFLLNLGDNFYDSGVTEDTRQKRFDELFLKVYGQTGFTDLPWYSIAGNNDYKMPEEEEEKIKEKLKAVHGKDVDELLEKQPRSAEAIKYYEILFEAKRKMAKAQIGYDFKLDKKVWNFPAEQYILHYQFGTKEKPVDVVIIMIDTLLICGASRKDFHEHNCDIKKEEEKKHFKWLEDMLAYANREWKPDYLFVGGHFTLYVTKPEDTKRDRSFNCAKKMQKLFRENNVTAYLSGHEHNLKYIEEIKDELVPQIVSGAGSKMEDCMRRKHTSNMANAITNCYPKFLLIEKKGDSFKKREEMDIFDGGAFTVVRVTAESAKFDYFAAGGHILTPDGAKHEFTLTEHFTDVDSWKELAKKILMDNKAREENKEKGIQMTDHGLEQEIITYLKHGLRYEQVMKGVKTELKPRSHGQGHGKQEEKQHGLEHGVAMSPDHHVGAVQAHQLRHGPGVEQNMNVGKNKIGHSGA